MSLLMLEIEVRKHLTEMYGPDHANMPELSKRVGDDFSFIEKQVSRCFKNLSNTIGEMELMVRRMRDFQEAGHE